MPSLPDITYRELIVMLKRFGCEFRGEGSPILVGKNRAGAPFTIHQHPSQKMSKARLAKALKYIGISREEFWSWYHGEN